jgi:LmbE family N-acetylglucosaminyl deacetylase
MRARRPSQSPSSFMQSYEPDFIPYTALASIGPGPAIVFAPHPDDEVFGCGGAIMRHVSNGDPVRVVIVTDGAYGAPAESGDYAQTRRRESTRAAAILGYGAPEFWNLPDRGLEYGERLIQRVLTAMEDHAAELVYAPSWWEVHPDHRVLALAATEAVRRCTRPLRLAMYEVGVPLQPNALLDITDLAERKASAVACFSSQLAQQDYDEQIASLNRFRTYTLPRTVRAAEGYLVLAAEELRNRIPRMMTQKDRLAVRGETGDTAATPLVSVIIPSMDGPRLKEALDSVALQTYPRIEAVVIDAKGDGHTPLPRWCGRFPLRFIPSDVSLSRGRAADVGLEHAGGDYLVFLGEEDVFQPGDVASLVAEAARKQGTGFCSHADRRMTVFSGGVVDGSPRTGKPGKPAFLPLHAVLFDRSLAELRCRFDGDANVPEDGDFWDQAMQHVASIHPRACRHGHGLPGGEAGRHTIVRLPPWTSPTPLPPGASLARTPHPNERDSLRRRIQRAGRRIYETLPRGLTDALVRTAYRIWARLSSDSMITNDGKGT